jgi:hypothetical protein
MERRSNTGTSHGFIIAAGNSSYGQGSGAEMLGCLDYLLQALMAGRDMRVTATAPLMPFILQGFAGFDQACIPKQSGVGRVEIQPAVVHHRAGLSATARSDH